MTSSLALMVETMEREFQKTWAQFTARQATALEQLCAQFASRVVSPSPSLSPTPLSEPFRALPQNGQAPLRLGPPQVADLEGRLDQVVRERDLARAECVRLREEAAALRTLVADRSARIARLGPLIEEQDAVRRERDALAAEATTTRARMVELECSLVEAESAREDCRERAQAEQRKWKQQQHLLIAQARKRLAEQRRQIEAERRAWVEHLQGHERIAHEVQSLRIKVKKLRDLYDATRQARDEAFRAVETLIEQRARFSAWLDEAEAERQEQNRTHQATIDRLNEALEEALEEAESAQAELARHRRAQAQALAKASTRRRQR
jgi:hypothetical protein